VGTVICSLVMFTLAYDLLLQDNFLHISIAGIISRSNFLQIKTHLLVLGLLPVYIATVIFGAGIASVYLGSSMQKLIRKACRNNTSLN
jgi:hypothetical protein